MKNKAKRLILLVLLAVVPAVAHQASTKPSENPYLRTDDFPGGYSILPNSLPPLIGMYMKMGGQHKINPTPKQEDIFEKQFEKMVKIFNDDALEIKDLETQFMKRVVYKGENPKQVQGLIEEIARKKISLTMLQVECINLFKENLNAKQYQQMLDIAEKFALENQSKRNKSKR